MANAVTQQTSAVDDAPERAPACFALDVTVETDLAVAWLSGDLDVDSAPRLTAALDATTATTGQRLVLDLSNLDFLDAAGLGAIVAARNALRSRAGDLKLRAPSPSITRILEITGLAGLAGQFAPGKPHRPPALATPRAATAARGDRDPAQGPP